MRETVRVCTRMAWPSTWCTYTKYISRAITANFVNGGAANDQCPRTFIYRFYVRSARYSAIGLSDKWYEDTFESSVKRKKGWKEGLLKKIFVLKYRLTWTLWSYTMFDINLQHVNMSSNKAYQVNKMKRKMKMFKLFRSTTWQAAKEIKRLKRREKNIFKK